MKVRVVTIEREFGSGAADIVRLLAERFGCKLWDQVLIPSFPMNFLCAVRLSCSTAFPPMFANGRCLHGRCCPRRVTNERQLNAVSQFKAPTAINMS